MAKSGGNTPIEATPIQQILAPNYVRVISVINTAMLNWTLGNRLIMMVTSTLDQAIVVQAVGNIRNTIVGTVNINAPLPCTGPGNITIGFAWDDWHPYIGAVITVPVAPTQGNVTVECVIQG